MQPAAITENLSPSLSADRLKLLINQSVKDVFPDATIKDLDGGKSSGNILERFRDAMGGQFVVMPVMGLCGARISARYLSAGDTAVVSAAEAAGVQLRQPGFGALNTTSFGVGELIGHALSAGHKHILVSLAGMVSADAGCGIAAALGVRFINQQGQPFLPVGGNLAAIDKIAPNQFFLRPHAQTITVLAESADTLNSPQTLLNEIAKEPGVEAPHLKALAEGFKHLANTIRRQGGEKILGFAGGLTGGGALAGLRGMIRAEVKEGGTEGLLEGQKVAEPRLTDVDYLVAVLPEVTEETLKEGALLGSLLQEEHSARVILLTKELKVCAKNLYSLGITSIFPLNFTVLNEKTPLREDEVVSFALENAMRLLK